LKIMVKQRIATTKNGGDRSVKTHGNGTFL